jgi:DNA-binding MarR family transcriptional regulator
MTKYRLAKELAERGIGKKELKSQLIELRRNLNQLLNRLRSIGIKVGVENEVAHKPPTTQALRVAEFFIERGNRPATARFIMKKTGISRSSLSQILHRTHKDKFISTAMPEYARKKLWKLTNEAVEEAAKVLQNPAQQRDLFDSEHDFVGLKAVECCARILREHENEPMNALTMARQALNRGYKGKVKASGDELLLTTAKSFWAALGRDERFKEVRPLVFMLKEGTEEQ